MRIPTKPPAAATSDLDAAVAAIRREADPLDDAMVAAIGGLAEGMKAEAIEMEDVRERMVRLARRAAR